MKLKNKILFILFFALVVLMFSIVSNKVEASTVTYKKDDKSYTIPEIPKEICENENIKYVVGAQPSRDRYFFVAIDTSAYNGFLGFSLTTGQTNNNLMAYGCSEHHPYIKLGVCPINVTDDSAWEITEGNTVEFGVYNENSTVFFSGNTNVYNPYPNVAEWSYFFNYETDSFTQRGTSGPSDGSGGSGNVENSGGNTGTTSTDYSSTGVFSWIAKGFENVVNFIKEVLSTVINLSKNLDEWFKNLGNSIGNFFKDLGNGIDIGFKNVGNWFSDIGNNIDSGVKSIGNWFSEIGHNIDNGVKSIGNTINNWFTYKNLEDENKKAGNDNANSTINSGVNKVKDKFSFYNNISSNASQMINEITNVESEPKYYINVNSKWYTGQICIVDLSWYAPFKELGDNIICIFCYLSFLWHIFIRLPEIIAGAGASSYAGNMVNDIEVHDKTGFGRSFISNSRSKF